MIKCTYVSSDCVNIDTRKYLLAAIRKINKILERAQSPRRKVILPQPHDRCLKNILQQLQDALRGKCYYLICDREAKEGELTAAVNCGRELLGKSPEYFKRGDALLHGSKCLVVIVEVTERTRKRCITIEQISDLFNLIRELIESQKITDWLDHCTKKPKKIIINPTKSPDIKLFNECGGLGIAVVPKKIEDIKTYEGFIIASQAKKVRKLILKSKPYILILTKKDVVASQGLEKWLPKP